MPTIRRRTFLKRALAASAAATFTISTDRAGARVLGANERLRVAVCGAGGRGRGHLGSYKSMDNVEVAWIIDADKRRLKDAENTTTDLRKALEDKNLDAVSVATPNHWHSLAVILCAQAGKHCYVEKPASHDIYEGRVALEAMLSDVPVIASRTGGLPESVGDGGILIDDFSNVDEWVNAIRLLDDVKEHRRMVAAGRKHLKKFSIEEETDRLLHIIKNVSSKFRDRDTK